MATGRLNKRLDALEKRMRPAAGLVIVPIDLETGEPVGEPVPVTTLQPFDFMRAIAPICVEVDGGTN